MKISIRTTLKTNELTKEDVKKGDILPYYNTARKIAQVEFVCHSDQKGWFNGIDVNTKARVLYPLWKSLSLQSYADLKVKEALESSSGDQRFILEKFHTWLMKNMKNEFLIDLIDEYLESQSLTEAQEEKEQCKKCGDTGLCEPSLAEPGGEPCNCLESSNKSKQFSKIKDREDQLVKEREELKKEAMDLMIRLLPPEEYGECEFCERLQNIIAELADPIWLNRAIQLAKELNLAMDSANRWRDKYESIK